MTAVVGRHYACRKARTTWHTLIGNHLLQFQYLIPHVWLIFKLQRRAEDLVAHIHDCVFVTPCIQVVYSILNYVQALMARGLKIVFSGEVCSECPCQACMESQVTTLRKEADMNLLGTPRYQCIPFL